MGNGLNSTGSTRQFTVIKSYGGRERKFIYDYCICGNSKHLESEKCSRCALISNGERVGKSNKGIPKMSKSLLIGECYFALAFIFGLVFSGSL